MSKESSREFLARTVRTKRQAELGREGRVAENERAAEPIVRELREAGFNVTWVADLRHFVKDYSGAIPILVKWLPLVQNAAVKSDIVRNLSLRSQKGLAPLLLSEYRKVPSDNDNLETMGLRVAIQRVGDPCGRFDIR